MWDILEQYFFNRYELVGSLKKAFRFLPILNFIWSLKKTGTAFYIVKYVPISKMNLVDIRYNSLSIIKWFIIKFVYNKIILWPNVMKLNAKAWVIQSQK